MFHVITDFKHMVNINSKTWKMGSIPVNNVAHKDVPVPEDVPRYWMILKAKHGDIWSFAQSFSRRKVLSVKITSASFSRKKLSHWCIILDHTTRCSRNSSIQKQSRSAERAETLIKANILVLRVVSSHSNNGSCRHRSKSLWSDVKRLFRT